MDPELIAYLDRHFEGIGRLFRETQDQIRENRTAIRENRTAIRENQAAIRENQTAIRENQTEIRENQAEIRKNRRQIDATQKVVEETQVLVEDLRSKIQTVAEGYEALDEKMGGRFDEAETQRADSESVLKAVLVSLYRRSDDHEQRITHLEMA